MDFGLVMKLLMGILFFLPSLAVIHSGILIGRYKKTGLMPRRIIFILMVLPLLSFAESEQPPWEDTSCYFDKIDLKLSPVELVKAYIKKEGSEEANSAKDSNWYKKALLCIGHIGGGEKTEIISGYKILSKKISGKSAEISIEYNVVGSLSFAGQEGELNSFSDMNKKKIVKFELEKTPYGWRISQYDSGTTKVFDKSAWKAVSKKDWVKGDLEKFKKVVGEKQ